MSAKIKKITTCFAFDDCAEEAARFYVSVFPGARIIETTHCGGDEPSGPKGRVRTVRFRLLGQEFFAFNGAHFKFTEGLSLMVSCTTQGEIDAYWRKLSKGGKEVACGWLRDRYGVCWQIVPSALDELLSDRDPKGSERVMKAVLEMTKLDIAALKRARKEKAPAQGRRSA